MDAMGIVGLKGKPMTVSGIRYILGNESYVGDKLLQKQAPRDFLTKKPDKNAKYESKYLVDDHEAVVSREVWDAVQLRLGQHQEEVVSGGYYDGRSHFLHGRVFCGDCGAMMTRRTVRCSSRPDNKETHKVWTCKERHKGRKGNGCLMRNIPEEELLAAICFQMGLPNARTSRLAASAGKSKGSRSWTTASGSFPGRQRKVHKDKDARQGVPAENWRILPGLFSLVEQICSKFFILQVRGKPCNFKAKSL